MGLRQLINEKPVLGWIVAAVLAIVATVLIIRMSAGGGGERSVATMRQEITVRDRETGETWTILRGELEKQLFARAYTGTLDPNVGLPNPKTGKLTGIPELHDSWDDLVARIKKEAAEVEAKHGKKK